MPLYKLTDLLLQKSGELSNGTLKGLQGFLSQSMKWSGEQFQNLSKMPVTKAINMHTGLEQAARGLLQASSVTSDGIAEAAKVTDEAFALARKSIHDADQKIEKLLFEHVGVASVAGSSFAGIDISKLNGSFRLNGADAIAKQIADDFSKYDQEKTTNGAVLCVPGLFCDESLWTQTGEPSYDQIIRNNNYYPVYVRFNPGNPIPENGRQLLELIQNLKNTDAFKNIKFKVISYSQGGLIFRSMMYQAIQENYPASDFIDHALFVNSPDGGSYLEKLGFWMGTTLERIPVSLVQIIGAIGNQRSDAMKDLSHGIIRPEDREHEQIERYSRELYFGELDDVMATQVYSVLAEDHELWSRWFGDGIIEEPSLERLTEKVFKKKKNPEKRSYRFTGPSHFQIMGDKRTLDIFERILKGEI